VGQTWIVAALLIICVGLSAFFSGSEIALSSIDKLTLKRLIKQDEKKGRRIEYLLMHPSRWLITILIGNNLVNVAAASLATLLVVGIVQGAPGRAVAIVIGMMTFILLVFGEITPKRYCQQHAEIIALKIAGPVLLLCRIFSPLVGGLNLLTQGILKVASSKEPKRSWLITEREIHALIDIGQEEGALEEREEKLLHGALEFDETQAREIMVPRTKMVCIEEKAKILALIDLIKKVGFSRIPVYKGKIDNVVGVAYAKDILSLIPRVHENLRVDNIMRPVLFVPYTTRLSEIFRKMQREKTHLAIIVDEYGGVAGMLTIEDLVEEIVGEIQDEYDLEKEQKIKIIKDGSALVEGDTDIDEINDELDTEFPEKTAAFESIGGFIVNKLGRIPQNGETIEFGNLRLSVVEADERRIKKIKIWKRRKEKEEEV
jgi:CBS domain containing-hemolysin-like protein